MKRLIEYTEASVERGDTFPSRNVLVWLYPRLAIAAEYSGRLEESATLYRSAEAYAQEIYPNEPIDKSGQFLTLRDAIIYMDSKAGVSWIKNAGKTPNQ